MAKRVIFLLSGRDPSSRVEQITEAAHVQAFVAQSSAEAFDERILPRLAGPDAHDRSSLRWPRTRNDASIFPDRCQSEWPAACRGYGIAASDIRVMRRMGKLVSISKAKLCLAKLPITLNTRSRHPPKLASLTKRIDPGDRRRRGSSGNGAGSRHAQQPADAALADRNCTLPTWTDWRRPANGEVSVTEVNRFVAPE
jgi:hypothetical protein